MSEIVKVINGNSIEDAITGIADFESPDLELVEENQESDLSALEERSIVPKMDWKNDEYSVLRKYISKVCSFEVLTNEKELELAKLYLEGNQEAAHRLVTSHMRLVVKIALEYRRYGFPMMELIAEGNCGLVTAVQKFDTNFGCRLSTYAILWIRAKIKSFILKSWSIVKIGNDKLRRNLFFNLSKIKKQLGLSGGTLTDAGAAKIAKYSGTKVKDVQEVELSLSQCRSISTEESEDMGISLVATNSTPEEITIEKNQEAIKKSAIKKALSALSVREQRIIAARWLSEKTKTLEELSLEFHVSKERIRQISESAMKKMKAILEPESTFLLGS